jgi:hypothetical protein
MISGIGSESGTSETMSLINAFFVLLESEVSANQNVVASYCGNCACAVHIRVKRHRPEVPPPDKAVPAVTPVMSPVVGADQTKPEAVLESAVNT